MAQETYRKFRIRISPRLNPNSIRSEIEQKSELAALLQAGWRIMIQSDYWAISDRTMRPTTEGGGDKYVYVMLIPPTEENVG